MSEQESELSVEQQSSGGYESYCARVMIGSGVDKLPEKTNIPAGPHFCFVLFQEEQQLAFEKQVKPVAAVTLGKKYLPIKATVQIGTGGEHAQVTINETISGTMQATIGLIHQPIIQHRHQ